MSLDKILTLHQTKIQTYINKFLRNFVWSRALFINLIAHWFIKIKKIDFFSI